MMSDSRLVASSRSAPEAQRALLGSRCNRHCILEGTSASALAITEIVAILCDVDVPMQGRST